MDITLNQSSLRLPTQVRSFAARDRFLYAIGQSACAFSVLEDVWGPSCFDPRRVQSWNGEGQQFGALTPAGAFL